MARSGQAAMRVQSVTPDVGSTTHPLPLVAASPASPAALAASRTFPGPAPASLGDVPIWRQAPRKSAAPPTARFFAFRTAHLEQKVAGRAKFFGPDGRVITQQRFARRRRIASIPIENASHGAAQPALRPTTHPHPPDDPADAAPLDPPAAVPVTLPPEPVVLGPALPALVPAMPPIVTALPTVPMLAPALPPAPVDDAPPAPDASGSGAPPSTPGVATFSAIALAAVTNQPA